MELYLDSADLKEIKEAFDWGILTGLTTTPTFMHRQGITDIDGAIVELSKLVPILQVEALGDTAEQIVAEAERILALGLDKETTVFKIPVSNIALKACKMLKDRSMRVNIHLVYTLNQAYLAMQAGADYVCPLVGRLQDQGHDALALIEQCVEAVNYYGYKTKIMFSSVRHAEHVRTAITAGVHTITVPWSVLKKLTENSLTTIGTDQFVEHTRLLTIKVKEAISQFNPIVSTEDTVFDALHKMTESGLGAVSIINEEGNLAGIFTDGDLRRNLAQNGKALLNKKMSKFVKKQAPISIQPNALLEEAVKIFKQKGIDNIVVVENQKPIGMLDVQDFVKMNLIA